jgi:hypothetical protein
MFGCICAALIQWRLTVDLTHSSNQEFETPSNRRLRPRRDRPRERVELFIWRPPVAWRAPFFAPVLAFSRVLAAPIIVPNSDRDELRRNGICMRCPNNVI